MQVHLSPRASEDLEEIARYFIQDSRSVAVRFIDPCERILVQWEVMPQIGAKVFVKHPRLGEVRKLMVPHLRKYLILYRRTETEIEVLRVIHTARDFYRLLK